MSLDYNYAGFLYRNFLLGGRGGGGGGISVFH